MSHFEAKKKKAKPLKAKVQLPKLLFLIKTKQEMEGGNKRFAKFIRKCRGAFIIIKVVPQV